MKWLLPLIILVFLPLAVRAQPLPSSQINQPGTIRFNPATALLHQNQLYARLQVYHFQYLPQALAFRSGEFAYMFPHRLRGLSVSGSMFDADIMHRDRLNIGYAHSLWRGLILGGRLGLKAEGYRKSRFEGFDFNDPLFRDGYYWLSWHADFALTWVLRPGIVVSTALQDVNYPRAGFDRSLHEPVKFDASLMYETDHFNLTAQIHNHYQQTLPGSYGPALDPLSPALDLTWYPLHPVGVGAYASREAMNYHFHLLTSRFRFRYDVTIAGSDVSSLSFGSHAFNITWSFGQKQWLGEPPPLRRLVDALRHGSSMTDALAYSLGNSTGYGDRMVAEPDTKYGPLLTFRLNSDSLVVEKQVLHVDAGLAGLDLPDFRPPAEVGDRVPADYDSVPSLDPEYQAILQYIGFSDMTADIVADPASTGRAGIMADVMRGRDRGKPVGVYTRENLTEAPLVELSRYHFNPESFHIDYAVIGREHAPVSRVTLLTRNGTDPERRHLLIAESQGSGVLALNDTDLDFNQPGILTMQLEAELTDGTVIRSARRHLPVLLHRRTLHYRLSEGEPPPLDHYDHAIIYLRAN